MMDMLLTKSPADTSEESSEESLSEELASSLDKLIWWRTNITKETSCWSQTCSILMAVKDVTGMEK